ncbi:MAG: phosphoethanolamine transferase [Burkholderiales bacterium PBB5]|nr:MAG: phosphoethanolamine transferase [Burkholderiales bacterium PBB5]
MTVAVALWLATLGNAALWRELAQLGLLQGWRGAGFALALVLIVASALVLLVAPLAWRWTLKPLLTLLLLAGAAGAHFMLSYRVVIDTPMITNVLQTDPREAGDLLTLRWAGTMALLGLLPAWAVWRTPLALGRWPQRLGRNLALALAALAVLVGAVLVVFQPLSANMRNHKQLRYLINPLNSLYALGDLAAEPFKRDSRVLAPLGTDARLQPPPGAQRPPLLLLVLGETGRAGSFGLNGYGRDTTPELAKLPVISWRNAWSCGTSTAASVPCMFSHLGRDGFDRRKTEHETLLDVAQRAGLAVLWLDNQSGCKGVCDRVPSASTTALKDPVLCADGECWDEILLKDLDQRIAALPAERRARGVLLVMHQMGSHGPAYFKRVPPAFKRFLPECATSVLQDCSRAQVVNAYDNTIAYTDHVLAGAIAWLGTQAPRFDAAMLYLADHGESLGENNLYLHGLPYALAPDVQKRVPWISWLSPGFAQRQRLSADCLRGRADAEVSHDHLFHSTLGLLEVRTSAYQPALDAYAPCRAPG